MYENKEYNNIINWINKNIKKLGLINYKKNEKLSYHFLIDTYAKLTKLNLLNSKYLEETIGIKNIVQSVMRSNLIGNYVSLLYNWGNINLDDYDLQYEYDNLIKIVDKFYNSSDNIMDNIYALQCIPYFKQKPQFKEKINSIIKEVLLDLANVSHLKYKYVKNKLYSRKMHNSFHFGTPYMILYYLSKLQSRYCILPYYAQNILKRVLDDAYNNINDLNCLDISLVMSSSPRSYKDQIKIGSKILKDRFNEGVIFNNTAFYYDNLEFGNCFVGSDLYTAISCLEGLQMGASFEWCDFIKDSKIQNKQNENNNMLSMIDKVQSNNKKDKIISMKMKNHCMAPLLDEGDSIDVKYCIHNINKQDILVFRHYKGMILAHRVIDIIKEKNKKIIITAADNGGLWGYPVFKRDIIGKVVKIHKKDESNVAI